MKYFVYFLLVFTIISCSDKKISIRPNNENIYFHGRIDKSNPEVYKLYWPGSSIKIIFKGTSAEALLKDERGENYYNVIVDDSVSLMRMDTIKKWYILAENLKDTIHTIELFKRTEYDRGKTEFFGFNISNNGKLLPVPKNARIIEFFGNSITCGYASEDYSGKDRPDSIYTNNYISYSTLTAHHFMADYYCTSKSGIGIMISWFDYNIHKIWDKIDPMNSVSLWDFSKVQPDIVVVNLFQNDSWLVNMPERKEFKEIFGTTPPTEEYIIDSYIEFIKKIRGVYPDANIICCLGSMDATAEGSKWPDYVTCAVKKIKNEKPNDKLFTCFFPYKDTPGHPKVEEQKVMADSLIGFIEKNIVW